MIKSIKFFSIFNLFLVLILLFNSLYLVYLYTLTAYGSYWALYSSSAQISMALEIVLIIISMASFGILISLLGLNQIKNRN